MVRRRREMEKVERMSGRGADRESSWDGKPSISKVAIISCNLVLMNALALNTWMYNELDYS
jgi:hypothetical protein